MPETSKRIKRLVREYAAISHDRELGQALRDLDVQFGRWRNGEINATELNNVIHQFHDGVSRKVADVVNEGVIFSVQDLSVAWESNFASPAHAAVRQLAEAEQGALRRAYAEALAREERERPEALSRAGILYALARR